MKNNFYIAIIMKLAKNKPKHICPAYRCKKAKANKKKFCHRHHAVNQKENNLVGYTYNILKQNAKTRKKVFTISLVYFKQWCHETNYLALKGRAKNKASIDRIIHTKGYEPGNLQILTVSKNVLKHLEDLKKEVGF